jgi:hypothetical protein
MPSITGGAAGYVVGKDKRNEKLNDGKRSRPRRPPLVYVIENVEETSSTKAELVSVEHSAMMLRRVEKSKIVLITKIRELVGLGSLQRDQCTKAE